jgi:3-methyladenine DNA glycosylase AlkD
MQIDDVLTRLADLGSPTTVAGMAHFGLDPKKAYGVSIPALRALAREIGRDHDLARALWATEIFEARLLAAMVADPAQTTDALFESWALDFDNWAVCDGVCTDLFGRTPLARDKAMAWSARAEEYVKRAGFVLMARIAVTDKKAPDADFEAFLPIIQREAVDPRDMVRKAVNWALRQIGKRSLALNAEAIETARIIQALPARSAHWIAADALRELSSDAVRARLRRKTQPPPEV